MQAIASRWLVFVNEIGVVQQDFSVDPASDAVMTPDPVGEFLEAAGLVRHAGERPFDFLAIVPQPDAPLAAVQPRQHPATGDG